MQKDMHYYGTYAMARAAGLKKEVSETIATAAQFVDDNARNIDLELDDGSSVHVIATAHHAVAIENTDEKDQRKVWVPFHFLPGNKGDSFAERLICRKNSPIMDEVLAYVYSQKNKDFFIELVGVVAHVYADSFSHYGFSGFSNDFNKVVQQSISYHLSLENMKTYIVEKIHKFKVRFIGGLAELASLGHGAVYTLPDRPYLKWSFKYEITDENVEHNNPETFMEGCKALFDYFSNIGRIKEELSDTKIKLNFEDIRETVQEILSLENTKNERINEWIKKASIGDLFGFEEVIPFYKSWEEDLSKLRGMDSDSVRKQKVFHFFQASSLYRTFILRDLLPRFDLLVG